MFCRLAIFLQCVHRGVTSLLGFLSLEKDQSSCCSACYLAGLNWLVISHTYLTRVFPMILLPVTKMTRKCDRSPGGVPILLSRLLHRNLFLAEISEWHVWWHEKSLVCDTLQWACFICAWSLRMAWLVCLTWFPGPLLFLYHPSKWAEFEICLISVPGFPLGNVAKVKSVLPYIRPKS
jgi:hypothetical protein